MMKGLKVDFSSQWILIHHILGQLPAGSSSSPSLKILLNFRLSSSPASAYLQPLSLYWTWIDNNARLATGSHEKWKRAERRNHCELSGVVEGDISLVQTLYAGIRFPRCVLNEEVRFHPFARSCIDHLETSLIDLFLSLTRRWYNGLITLLIAFINIILVQEA